MKTLRNLYLRFFGVAESAAVVSKKPAYFYEVFEEDGDIIFSWYNESHTEGAVHNVETREVALLLRAQWLKDMHVKGNLVVPVGVA